MRRIDLVEMTELAYRLDGDLRSWLERLARTAAGELNQGHGMVAFVASHPRPLQVVMDGPCLAVDGAPRLADTIRQMNSNLPPHVAQALFFSGYPCRTASELVERFRIGR